MTAAPTTCVNHRRRPRVATCGACGNAICSDCIVHTAMVDDRIFEAIADSRRPSDVTALIACYAAVVVNAVVSHCAVSGVIPCIERRSGCASVLRCTCWMNASHARRPNASCSGVTG